MEQLIAMLGGGKKGAMVDEDKALPGRQQAMNVTNKHYVLGNPSGSPSPTTSSRACSPPDASGAPRRCSGASPASTPPPWGTAPGFTQNPTYEEVCSGRTGH